MVNDEAPSSLLGRLRNGTWLDAQEFPPLEWIVPGLVAEGFGLVVGPPKLGKSWFVLGLALASACGGRALGRIPVEGRPVLYAALEDGDRRMQSRARRLMGNDPLPERFEYFTNATPVEILPILNEWLDQNLNGLVLLDTLGKVMPQALPGESAYQRDYRVGGRLKNLTDGHPGSALLVVHHNRKMSSSDWMDSTSGTQGLNGSADYTIVLERSRGDGEALLKVSGRDVTEGEYALTLSDGAWQLSGESLAAASAAAAEAKAASGLGEGMAALVAYIGEHPEGVSPSEAAQAMGWDDRKTSAYLSRLLEAGRIEKPKRGTYTPVGSVGSVGLQPPNPTLPTQPTPLGESCEVCGGPLDAAIVAEGFHTHPSCGGDEL